MKRGDLVKMKGDHEHDRKMSVITTYRNENDPNDILVFIGFRESMGAPRTALIHIDALEIVPQPRSDK